MNQLDEDTALRVALALSNEEYKRNSRLPAAENSTRNDYDYAYRLQQEEYAKEGVVPNQPTQSTPPSSSNVRDNNRKNPISRVFDAVSNAIGNNIR